MLAMPIIVETRKTRFSPVKKGFALGGDEINLPRGGGDALIPVLKVTRDGEGLFRAYKNPKTGELSSYIKFTKKEINDPGSAWMLNPTPDSTQNPFKALIGWEKRVKWVDQKEIFNVGNQRGK